MAYVQKGIRDRTEGCAEKKEEQKKQNVEDDDK
jgi:hypothetical protein